MIYVLLEAMLLAACTPEGKPSVTPPDGGGDDGGGNTEEPSGKTYKTGDIYDNGFIRGMVFLTDQDGKHGMLISLEEIVTVWSYVEEDVMGGFPKDGLSNTRAVYKKPNWRKNYPAFLWCSNMNVMGIDRWFIPNSYELNQLYSVYSADPEGFNAMLRAAGGDEIKDEIYWTSNECGIGIAQPFDMNIGDNIFQDMDKRLTYRFRAFCSF